MSIKNIANVLSLTACIPLFGTMNWNPPSCNFACLCLSEWVVCKIDLMNFWMKNRSHGWPALAAIGTLALPSVVGWPQPALQNPIEPKTAEFFETKVRPVLADKCFSCHGTSMQLGGIRL